MDTTYQIQAYSKDIESHIKKIYPMDVSKFQWCHIGLNESESINVDTLIKPGNYVIDYYEPIDIISSNIHPIVIHVFEMDDFIVQCMQYGYNAVYRTYIDEEYILWKFTDYTIDITRSDEEPPISDNENGNMWIDTKENIVKVYSESDAAWKPIIDTNFIDDSTYNIKNIEADIFSYIDFAIQMTTNMIAKFDKNNRYQIAKNFVFDSYELYELDTLIIAKFISNSKYYYYTSTDGVNWALLSTAYFNTDIIFTRNQNAIIGVPIDTNDIDMIYKLTNMTLSLVRLPISGNWKDIAIDNSNNVYLMNDTTIYKIYNYTMSYAIIEDSADNSTSRLHWFTNYLFKINDSIKQIDVFYRDNKYYTINVAAIDENADDIIVAFWKEIPVIMTNGSVYISRDFNMITEEKDITWTKLAQTGIKKISSTKNLIIFSDTTMYIYFTFDKFYQYTLIDNATHDNIAVTSVGVFIFENMKYVNIYYYTNLVDVVNAHIHDTILHPPLTEQAFWNHKLSTTLLTSMIDDLTTAGKQYSDNSVADTSTDIAATKKDTDTLRANINTHATDTKVHLTPETIKKWDEKAEATHTHEFDNRVKISANDVVGVISMSQIPAAALDRLYYVLESKRFTLTTAQVQNGDIVASIPEGLDTKIYDVYELCTFYKVINDTKLNSEEGYYEFASNLMSEVSFATIEGTPTIVSEYGITDVDTKHETTVKNTVFKNDISEVINIKIENLELDVSDIKEAYNIHSNDKTIHISRVEATLFNSKSEKNHTHNITGIVIDGKDIISGVFPLEQLPAGVFDTVKTVSSIDAMYKLTTADVHIGNVVRVVQNGTMQYFKVIDDTNLSNSFGYFEFKNNQATQVTWANVTEKPKSLTEYGITNVYTVYEMNTSIITSKIIAAVADSLQIYLKQVTDTFIANLNAHLTGIPASARLQHTTPAQIARWGGKSDKNHTHKLDGRVAINASQIKSGTIKRDYLPKEAFDIVKNVFSENEKYALTKNDVQNGDVVAVYEPPNLYITSEDFSSDKWINKHKYTFTPNGYMGLTVASGTTRWYGLCQVINVAIGEKYRYSAYVKTSNPANTVGVAMSGSTPSNTGRVDLDIHTGICTTTEWHRVSYEFTVTQSGTLRPSVEPSVEGVQYWICGIRLERLKGYDIEKAFKDYNSYDTGVWENRLSYTIAAETYNGLTVLTRSKPWQGLTQYINCAVGERYRISAYIKAAETGIIRCAPNVGNLGTGLANPNGIGDIGATTEWKLLSYDFVIVKSGTLRPGFESGKDGVQYWICGLMVEKLSRRTDVQRKLYKVIDDMNLNNPNGYIAFETLSPALAYWNDVINTPKTVYGYHISNLYTMGDVDRLLSALSAKMKVTYPTSYDTTIASLNTTYTNSLFTPTQLIKNQVDGNLIGTVIENGKPVLLTTNAEILNQLSKSFIAKYTELLTLLG